MGPDGKSVRRVESARKDADHPVLTTTAVPVTEVVKDAPIPVPKQKARSKAVGRVGLEPATGRL
jgi:hypothetical protein